MKSEVLSGQVSKEEGSQKFSEESDSGADSKEGSLGSKSTVVGDKPIPELEEFSKSSERFTKVQNLQLPKLPVWAIISLKKTLISQMK